MGGRTTFNGVAKEPRHIGQIKGTRDNKDSAVSEQTDSGIYDFLTIDVEDWFHILEVDGTPNLEEWDHLPSRVEKNFEKMIALLDQHQVKATCFFLGWVAEHFPHLVRMAADAGHEIASHGYAHQLITSQSHEDFSKDITRAKKLLEDISGMPVWGYRAPGFSIKEDTKWALDLLKEVGYRYDASIFPGSHGHGGIPEERMDPHLIHTASGDLVEIPVSMVQLMGKRVCFFGGGYLRLFPYWLCKNMTDKIHREDGRPTVFYVHPREIDPDQPTLKMGLFRRFKSYVNINTTENKIDRLMNDYNFITIREWLRMGSLSNRRPVLS